MLDLFEILRRLTDEGLTILLVEENAQMALAISDDAYLLADGRVTIEGPFKAVANNKQVWEAHLGI